ncbi:hypothetical protein ABT224_11825 [Streptomyces sp. NPDC001584]|uniref:hypothetical protein n=1 Tax=Streptomyces sp. NPDC001584 TaxID=3154521 RepID=UPI00331E3B6B
MDRNVMIGPAVGFLVALPAPDQRGRGRGMDDRWTGLLHGLVVNTAAPSDVLIRLPGLEDDWVRRAVPRRSDLPPEVVDAILAHPDRRVRWAFAENAEADPAQRARLLDDPDPRTAAAAAANPALPPEDMRRLPDRAHVPEIPVNDRTIGC